MAYGDYNGPDKPNKGIEGGACNRQRCQAEPAVWFNHGSYAWYCDDCRRQIQFDPVNYRNWQINHQPECQHPMFETREMMTEREALKPIDNGIEIGKGIFEDADQQEQWQRIYDDRENHGISYYSMSDDGRVTHRSLDDVHVQTCTASGETEVLRLEDVRAMIAQVKKCWSSDPRYIGMDIGIDAAKGSDVGIEVKRMPIEDDQPIWDRPGNCLRASNPRVVVCHCAKCGGK